MNLATGDNLTITLPLFSCSGDDITEHVTSQPEGVFDSVFCNESVPWLQDATQLTLVVGADFLVPLPDSPPILVIQVASEAGITLPSGGLLLDNYPSVNLTIGTDAVAGPVLATAVPNVQTVGFFETSSINFSSMWCNGTVDHEWDGRVAAGEPAPLYLRLRAVMPMAAGEQVAVNLPGFSGDAVELEQTEYSSSHNFSAVAWQPSAFPEICFNSKCLVLTFKDGVAAATDRLRVHSAQGRDYSTVGRRSQRYGRRGN